MDYATIACICAGVGILGSIVVAVISVLLIKKLHDKFLK